MKKHKRYVGNYMTIFTAIALPIMLIILIALAYIFVLHIETMVLALLGLSVVGFLFYFIIVKEVMQLYAWCEFTDTCVRLTTIFGKKYELKYDECKDIGVGYYFHRALNSSLGSKVLCIYLSYEYIPKRFKTQMNQLHSSATCFKIGYSKKTLDFLLENLPQKQKQMLERNKQTICGRTE